MFGRYLEALTWRTGTLPDESASWHSMLITRVKRTFEALPWLLATADHPDTDDPGRAVVRLHHDLAELNLA